MASSAFFKNKGVRWVTAGWIGFITENLVLSHNREWIIREYGNDEYHIAYNILSTTACSSIAFGFWKYGKVGATMAPRGPLLKLAGFGLSALGLAGLSQLAPAFQVPIAFGGAPAAVTTPTAGLPEAPKAAEERKLYVRCPIDFRHKNEAGGIFGMERITRHPTLWFMGLTGLGVAMTSIHPTTVVLCSFPIVFAMIGGEHQDYRYRRGNGGQLTPEMDHATSNVPFLALLQGRQAAGDLVKEIKWTNAAIAVLTAAIIAARRL